MWLGLEKSAGSWVGVKRGDPALLLFFSSLTHHPDSSAIPELWRRVWQQVPAHPVCVHGFVSGPGLPNVPVRSRSPSHLGPRLQSPNHGLSVFRILTVGGPQSGATQTSKGPARSERTHARAMGAHLLLNQPRPHSPGIKECPH